MTTKINATTSGLTETVDTSGVLEIQTSGGTAIIIGSDQNANFATTGAITVPVGTTAQRPTPANGMMRYNSNVSVFEVYANGSWAAANVTPAPTNTVAPVISGSAIVGQNLTCTTGTWSGSPTSYFYQWNANASPISGQTANVITLTLVENGANVTCNVIAQNIAGNSSPATSNTLGPVILGTTVSYLIVAGGGSGGAGWAGGGGAGGLQTGTTILQPANTYAITIGAGGAGTASGDGNNGSNSSIGSLTASVGGGGGGGAGGARNGKNGGSGGGAEETYTPGTGVSGQGYAGAAGNGGSVSNASGGGGGGAGAAGSAGSTGQGGNGGVGVSSSISGTATYYAGGGGGAGGSVGAGTGGTGGGGAGNYNGSNNGFSGTASTGGGGGASSSNGTTYGTSGNGGSGIVIISYAGAQAFGGGVVSTDGSNTIHTFYTSGSLVPLTSLNAGFFMVAGGGSGGYQGGGGGAGGVLSGSNVTIDSSSTYIITVGAGGATGTTGGAVGNPGANSTFSAYVTAAVGGGGGGGYNQIGGNGGSGGGNGYEQNTTVSTPTSGQGFAGGRGFGASAPYTAGGGGGASAVGGNAANPAAGAGGNGVSSSISGVATYYAGGGGGSGNATWGGTAGAGGIGGGGAGSAGAAGTAGTANTGGGGGGGGNPGGSGSYGGAGGSGIVFITYPGSTPQMAGGNVTIVSNTVVHTFTSSGYLTPFVLVNSSLRFRQSNSAYLSRTPTTTGNRKTWTWSAWVKRGTLTGDQALFFAGSSSYNNTIRFNSDNTMYVFRYDTSITWGLSTTQVFRDPAAWYHIVVAFDTTQTTSTNRVKLYVNGSQVTSFSSSSYPSLNADNDVDNTVAHQISNNTGSNYFDGEMTEIRFIDGQALTPNSFGTFNQYGVWQPVAYAGSYGTNGFYLPFTNTANTTALGYDFSPQGNNWTTNNISLTAGSTYDSMTDVPTLTSANVANYCVVNPLDTGGATMTNGNLTQTTPSSGYGTTRGTLAVSSGKWYWEVTPSSLTAGAQIGICSPTETVSSSTQLYNLATAYTYWQNGDKGSNGSSGAYGASFVANDVIGVALDLTAGTIVFYKNNTSQGTAYSSLSGTFTPAICDNSGSSSSVFNVNYGQQPFAYTPPSGFVALNTYNL